MKEEVKLGELITDERQRDAIHIAVCPVIAGEELFCGQSVGIIEQNDHEIVVGKSAKKLLGVIDPFLYHFSTQKVEKGQKCWMLLFPNTITSLRHEWTHPHFHYEHGQTR